jgi:hypothetical protein
MAVFDHDPETAERRGHLGVREALSRCSKAITDGDVDRMYVATIETVVWIRSLHERYEITVRAHPGGAVVESLCWVRDKGIHQLVTLHDHAERGIGGLGFGPSFPNGHYPIWLHSQDVVLRDPARPSDKPKVEAYDELLAGMPVWASMAAAGDFLFLYARPGGGWQLLEGAEFIGAPQS